MTREEYIDFANALKNNYTIDFNKLPEFCDMAISAVSENKGDLISRQAVLDIVKNCYLDLGKFEDCRVLCTEIRALPSIENKGEIAEEIIRCKDCKYSKIADPKDNQDGYTCQFHRGSIWFSGSYCSWAEKRGE